MKPSPERIAFVERQKWLSRLPMSEIELARYKSEVAAVKARDEAVRAAPSPQLELGEAA